MITTWYTNQLVVPGVDEVGLRDEPADVLDDDAHHAEHTQPVKRAQVRNVRRCPSAAAATPFPRHRMQRAPASWQRPRQSP